MQIIRFSLRSVVLFSLIALFLASAAQAQRTQGRQIRPTSIKAINVATQQEITIPANHLPEVSIYQNIFAMNLSVSFVPLFEYPITNVVDVFVGRDGNAPGFVHGFELGQERTKNRWFFKGSDEARTYLQRELGDFAAAGQYHIEVYVYYVWQGIKAALVYEFDAHVDQISMLAQPCLGTDGDVWMEFYLQSMFPVPDGAQLSWQVEGADKDFVSAVHPNTGVYANEYSLYAAGHFTTRTEYDDVFAGTDHQIGAEMLGASTSTGQYFYTYLQQCGQGRKG